ncbi:MAG TPA: hypothetical protein PK228_01450 [Saprospiraceae bacterium]|nr:hypothetical protein [Saprospiraceae bacterium]
MKQVVFVLMLWAPVWVRGQTVDGVNLGEKKEVEYVELVGVAKMFSQKITVRVDYGQKFDWDNDTKVDGPDGKAIVFNSMMDAVNRFSGWGWELMFAYDVSTGQGGTVYHYVMRRKGKTE